MCISFPTTPVLYVHLHLVAVWRSGSALVLINEVNLRRARSVEGWVTVSEFDSQGRIAEVLTVCRFCGSFCGIYRFAVTWL